MNKAILFGHVGQDPEVRVTSGGKKVASFSLATSKKVKDNSVTQWHNIIVWEKLADLVEQYVTKGSSLIVEGEITYRSYDDKNGNRKYITEIICNSLHFAGKKEGRTTLDAAAETVQESQSTDLPF